MVRPYQIDRTVGCTVLCQWSSYCWLHYFVLVVIVLFVVLCCANGHRTVGCTVLCQQSSYCWLYRFVPMVIVLLLALLCASRHCTVGCTVLCRWSSYCWLYCFVPMVMDSFSAWTNAQCITATSAAPRTVRSSAITHSFDFASNHLHTCPTHSPILYNCDCHPICP